MIRKTSTMQSRRWLFLLVSPLAFALLSCAHAREIFSPRHPAGRSEGKASAAPNSRSASGTGNAEDGKGLSKPRVVVGSHMDETS